MSARDTDRQKVYDAESFAFQGTPLVDRLSEADITAAYEQVRQSPLWVGPDFTVVRARVDMTEWSGKANSRLNLIRTAAKRVSRDTVSHECAHLVHGLHRRPHDQPHGFEFRTCHVQTVTVIFGEQYGRLLEEAYDAHGLAYRFGHASSNNDPIIDIDAMSIATAPRGGWSRT